MALEESRVRAPSVTLFDFAYVSRIPLLGASRGSAFGTEWQQYELARVGDVKLFYAHAGKIAAAKHSPLTVFNKVPISVVEPNISLKANVRLGHKRSV